MRLSGNVVYHIYMFISFLDPKAQVTNPASANEKGSVVTSYIHYSVKYILLKDFFYIIFQGHAVMPNTAIPSPLVGSDEKEQVLNIGKHPSLVKVGN